MTGTHWTVTMINDDREGNNNKGKLSCKCLVCLFFVVTICFSKSRYRSISPFFASLVWKRKQQQQTNKSKSKIGKLQTRTTPGKVRNKIKLTFQILDRQNRLLAQSAENPYKRASPDCRKKKNDRHHATRIKIYSKMMQQTSRWLLKKNWTLLLQNFQTGLTKRVK